MLTSGQRELLESMGVSRRRFLKVASLLTAGTTFSFANEAALAQLSAIGPIEAGAVKINANENPMGMTEGAIEAYMRVARDGGRYNYEATFEIVNTLAAHLGVSQDTIKMYPGSSLPLHHAVIAFTSPERGLVTVDPGYEAAAGAAGYLDVPVTRVPLNADASQDVRAMAAAAKNAGAIYLCTPNNPTAAVVPAADVSWLVENAPAGCVIIVDEAYTHFTDEPSAVRFVKEGRDVVVLRTFSKIYGMAGLRAGYAVGRPALLQKMSPLWTGALPASSMAAANTMLLDPQVVPTRKKQYDALRSDLEAFFAQRGYKFAPGCSNKIFVDTGRPVQQVIDAMALEKVYIGRPWPAWPTHARVTLGLPAEMEIFKTAFVKVMAG